jgi:hypothetical protein
MKFFYGCDGSGADRKMLGGYVPYVLISACRLWAGKKFRSWVGPRRDELFLDSGGFSFFSHYQEYPFSIEQYVELARRENATYIATLDYPCEPLVFRADGDDNYKRIERSVKNAAKCLDSCSDLNWVTVIQGYSLSEYRYCVQRLKDEDLLTDIMAVGSLCVRKKSSEVRRVLSTIAKLLPGTRLHGFGIDMRMLRDPVIRRLLYSTDSLAWHFKSKEFRDADFKCFRCPTEADKLHNLEIYAEKIQKLIERDKNQTYLFCQEPRFD